MKQVNIAIGAFRTLILIAFVWRIGQTQLIQDHQTSPIPDTGPETNLEKQDPPATTISPATTDTSGTTNQSSTTEQPNVTHSTSTTPEINEKDNEKSELKFVRYPEDIDTIVGKPFTLRCEVEGEHQPTISWNKDNKSLDNDHVIIRKESIRIRSAVSSDQGTYTCVAKNKIGMVAESSAKVTVTSESCGQQIKLPRTAKRIIGGKNAAMNQWPWQVLIEYPEQNGNILCGGSLIGKHWVLTAAHCTHNRMYWYNTGELRVRAGVYNRSIFDLKQQVLKIKRIITHPKYQWDKLNFDIALLQLKNPAKMTDRVGTICLPESGSSVAAGTKCVATGWGHTKLGEAQLPELLQEVVVPIVSRSRCNRPAAYSKKLPKHTICAGYDEGGKDSCQNDSGGPLSCLEQNRYVLRGVTNMGTKCALPNKYGIYADVSKYIGWITKETNARS